MKFTLFNFNYEKLISRHFDKHKAEFSRKIDSILEHDEKAVNVLCNGDWEFALPGCRKYMDSGYYKYMFGRYFYALPYVKDKVVLDTGCGLGWGSYLLSDYAKELTAIDVNSGAIDFARREWKGQNLNFLRHSALELEALGKKFDVILGFEFIEHLNFHDGLWYLVQAFNALNAKGVLILSSVFAADRQKAEEVRGHNSNHLYIFTRDELKMAARKAGFRKIDLVGGLLAKAVK